MNKSKYTKCNKPCDFQPSKEEEKHKLCSDYQKACNQCYQEFKDWQKSDESKSQSWEDKLECFDYPTAWRLVKASKHSNHHEKCSWRVANMLCDCVGVEMARLARNDLKEFIQSLLTSAIEEERKRSIDLIQPLIDSLQEEMSFNQDMYMTVEATIVQDKLRELQNKILNPNEKP